MKILQLYRSTRWIAALTALLLASANAGAAQINVGGFADNGSLTITFDGIEQGGDPIKLEGPFPDTITSFSAVYTDDGLVGSREWGLLDLGSLVYNTSTGVLEVLSALDIVSFTELSIGNAVTDSNNYAELTELSSFSLVASSSEFPGTVPIPAAAWLFGSALVGLVAIRRRKVLAT